MKSGANATMPSAVQCIGCGTRRFPRVEICDGCLGVEFAEQPLCRTGVLYSYTKVHRKHEAPFMLGYADLADGLRVLGLLECDRDIGIGVAIAVDAAPPDSKLVLKLSPEVV